MIDSKLAKISTIFWHEKVETFRSICIVCMCKIPKCIRVLKSRSKWNDLRYHFELVKVMAIIILKFMWLQTGFDFFETYAVTFIYDFLFI